MRKPILLFPVALALLIGAVAWTRLHEPRERSLPQAALKEPETPRIRVRPAASPAQPAPVAGTPEQQGKAFHRVLLGDRMQVYLNAALSSNEATRSALLGSLRRYPSESRAIAHERIAKSKSSHEIQALNELLVYLK